MCRKGILVCIALLISLLLILIMIAGKNDITREKIKYLKSTHNIPVKELMSNNTLFYELDNKVSYPSEISQKISLLNKNSKIVCIFIFVSLSFAIITTKINMGRME